jgi:OST3 / OST6 family, transporter family
MWNSIRRPPFLGQDPTGRKLAFIYPTFQQQFQLETWLIAILYGGASFMFLALIYFVPKVDDPGLQTSIFAACLFTLLLLLSFVAVAFRLKGTGYAYGFLF